MSTVVDIVQVGVIGLAIRFDFSKDVSAASSIAVYLKRDKGDTKTFVGTKVTGAANQAEYVTVAASDLDTAGKWYAQGKAVWSTGKTLPSEVVEFDVRQNLYP